MSEELRAELRAARYEVQDLTERLDAITGKMARLFQVMGHGERMGDPDDKIMKEIRRVLWHE